MRSSISALAQAAGVSEPTVNRFARSLGFDGFAAFKLGLAQSMGRGERLLDAGVEPGDTAPIYGQKIVGAAIEALTRARDALEPAAIEAAVAALGRARQILLMGVGASGPVALDAQHKLARLDIPTVAHLDPIMQRLAALSAKQADVLLAISGSGRTQLVVESARLAREQGATVLALTAPRSPLAAEADILLAVEPAEDSDLNTPMGSRLVHLAMIDVLVTGLVLARGQDFIASLARLKASLGTTRLPL